MGFELSCLGLATIIVLALSSYRFANSFRDEIEAEVILEESRR